MKDYKFNTGIMAGKVYLTNTSNIGIQARDAEDEYHLVASRSKIPDLFISLLKYLVQQESTRLSTSFTVNPEFMQWLLKIRKNPTHHNLDPSEQGWHHLFRAFEPIRPLRMTGAYMPKSEHPVSGPLADYGLYTSDDVREYLLFAKKKYRAEIFDGIDLRLRTGEAKEIVKALLHLTKSKKHEVLDGTLEYITDRVANETMSAEFPDLLKKHISALFQ